MIPEEDLFARAVRAMFGAAADAQMPMMVIGGIAVIAHGIPRTTGDIDATVRGDCDLDAFMSCLAAKGIIERIEGAVDFARKNQVLLLQHEQTGVSLDISLAWLPFELEALAHSVSKELGQSELRVPRPEDLLIYKVVAARPKDIEDAEKLLLLHRQDMNLERVKNIVRQFSDALEDAERVQILDALLDRTK